MLVFMPSVLWRCWLGGRKGIRPVKTEWWGAGTVISLEWGADLHTAQLMPLPLTVSCFSKIQIGFTFLVPAHPGSPGQRAVKRVCVSVLKVQTSPLLIKGNLTQLDLLTGNRVSVEWWHHQTLVHSMELAFTDNKPITEQSRDDPSNQHETDACTRHTQTCQTCVYQNAEFL